MSKRELDLLIVRLVADAPFHQHIADFRPIHSKREKASKLAAAKEIPLDQSLMASLKVVVEVDYSQGIGGMSQCKFGLKVVTQAVLNLTSSPRGLVKHFDPC